MTVVDEARASIERGKAHLRKRHTKSEWCEVMRDLIVSMEKLLDSTKSAEAAQQRNGVQND